MSWGRGFHSDDLRGVTQAAATGQSGAPLIARQKGEEFGVRQQLVGGKVAITLALFNLDAESETTYDPDAGEDGAGPGSRRRGYEINLTYQALKWLELYASYSGDHARFTADFDDGTGHVGRYLPNAPFATGSFNIYVKNLGAWSGGLEYRYLGREPLSADNAIQSAGYGELNARRKVRVRPGLERGPGGVQHPEPALECRGVLVHRSSARRAGRRGSRPASASAGAPGCPSDTFKNLLTRDSRALAIAHNAAGFSVSWTGNERSVLPDHTSQSRSPESHLRLPHVPVLCRAGTGDRLAHDSSRRPGHVGRRNVVHRGDCG